MVRQAYGKTVLYKQGPIIMLLEEGNVRLTSDFSIATFNVW
jgi:hypothetical protein